MARVLKGKARKVNNAIGKLRNAVQMRCVTLYWQATAMWSAVWTATLFPANGLNLALASGQLAASLGNPGESPYNNLVDSNGKPKFKFKPVGLSFFISDTGDATKVSTILMENARFQLKYDSIEIVNQPLLTLVGGRDRSIAHANTAASTVYADRARYEQGTGVFRLPKGLVFHSDKAIEANLFIPSAILTVLAAQTGSSPAQGFSLGPIFYGIAEKPLVPSTGD